MRSILVVKKVEESPRTSLNCDGNAERVTAVHENPEPVMALDSVLSIEFKVAAGTYRIGDKIKVEVEA